MEDVKEFEVIFINARQINSLANGEIVKLSIRNTYPCTATLTRSGQIISTLAIPAIVYVVGNEYIARSATGEHRCKVSKINPSGRRNWTVILEGVEGVSNGSK